jgi:alpha-tubulin suppressor-like RCC1 family protein
VGVLAAALVVGVAPLALAPTPSGAAIDTQQAKITPSDGAANEWFGQTVSIDGETMVVGAQQDDDAGHLAGSAYVFTRSGNTWTQQAKLTPSDATGNDRFGWSVSISGDTVVIGAVGSGYNTPSGQASGAAYVFVRSGSVWSQQAKLQAANVVPGELFGNSASISGDTIVIGTNDQNPFVIDPGSAYVFRRSGSVWSQQAKLVASDAVPGDEFGAQVSVSGDTIVVGAPFKDDGGNDAGSAYVFTRSGAVWSQQAKLAASDAAAGHLFGSSVSVSGDTTVIAVPGNDDGGTNSGSAYVFTRSGTAWSQQAKLITSDAADNDRFGRYVAVSGDTVVASDTRERTWVFHRAGSTWTEEAKLVAADAAAGDAFGAQVSVSGDTVAVGAHRDDDNGTNSGSTYVFVEPTGGPFTLTPGNVGVVEADTTVQVPINLNMAAPTDISVDYATANLAPAPGIAAENADFVPTSGTLTIPAGQTTGYVTLGIKDDLEDEVPLLWGEWVIVTFTNPSLNATVQGGFYHSSIVIIVDNDDVPKAPAAPVATAGNAEAEVTWAPPANTGTGPITGYVVTPYIGATAQTPQLFDATSATRTITGLTNGTEYTFTVAATNYSGAGPESPASNPVTPTAPQVVGGLIAAGGLHTCAVASGAAACWGYNELGQLGNGTIANSSVPVDVDTTGVLAGKTITQIVAGGYHSCVLTSDGTVACWGHNAHGQLGNGATANSSVPVAVDTSGGLAGKTITRLTAGDAHTCALTSDGAAACWGRNLYGQLGNGATANSSVPVAVDTSGVLAGKTTTQIDASGFHTCALTSDGTAACWGYNIAGQLGNNTLTDSAVPVTVDASGVLAGKTITQVITGSYHSCVMTSSGTTACWGNNIYGQLGNNTLTNSPVAVTVDTTGLLNGKTVTRLTGGGSYTCAVTGDNTTACWGFNNVGQLGDGTTTDSLMAVAVDTTGILAGKTITQIDAGVTHTCVVTTDDTFACWGANNFGKLGNGTTTGSPVPVAVWS